MRLRTTTWKRTTSYMTVNLDFALITLHTTQATFLIGDKFQKAIDEFEYSFGLFLDLSKALDTVNH